MKTLTFIGLILWLLVLAVCPVWADPAITPSTGVSWTGSIGKGSEVTISGSGFGTGPTIYRWDDFEASAYVVGQSVRSCNADWTDRILTYPTLVSNSHNRTGSTKHTQFLGNGAGSEADSGLMYTHSTSQLSPVYMTCYRRVTTTGTDGTMKWEWIVDSQGASPMNYDYHSFGTSTPTIYSTYFTEAVGVRCRCGGTTSTANDTIEYFGSCQEGQWLRAEYFGIESTPNTSDGTIWQAHQLSDTGTFQTIVNSTSIMTRHCETYWDRVVFGWYIHGNYEDYSYDDIYIANSRARVEIGNESTFSACTHREIQGNIDSWSASSIVVGSLNIGSFGASDSVYLFVVDSSGAASSGYPITLGDGGSSPSTPTIRSGSIRNGGLRP